MTKDQIIAAMKTSSGENNILSQRFQAQMQMFSAEVQSGNNTEAERLRDVIHAIVDNILDSSARMSQLCRDLYLAED